MRGAPDLGDRSAASKGLSTGTNGHGRRRRPEGIRDAPREKKPSVSDSHEGTRSSPPLAAPTSVNLSNQGSVRPYGARPEVSLTGCKRVRKPDVPSGTTKSRNVCHGKQAPVEGCRTFPSSAGARGVGVESSHCLGRHPHLCVNKCVTVAIRVWVGSGNFPV